MRRKNIHSSVEIEGKNIQRSNCHSNEQYQSMQRLNYSQRILQRADNEGNIEKMWSLS